MAHTLIMPRQGNTVESCIIVRWKVAEGATVGSDQTICEVETDKASFDVPAETSGILLKILRPEGDDVPVLAPIAVIGEQGEDWRQAVVASGAALPAMPGESVKAVPAATPPTPEKTALSGVAAGQLPSGAAPVSPRARKLASAEGLDAASLAGSGPGGRIIERDVAAALTARPPLTAAAKAAVAAGARRPSTAPARPRRPGGRVGMADLEHRSEGLPRYGASGKRPTTVSPSLGESGRFSETPLRGVRKLISERMRASLAGTAQLTFNSSANARQLQALRARFKASDPALGLSEVTIGDLVLYAVSRVLPRFPDANATLESGILRVYERIHLALAVDTPRGLMVPVIRDADLLSLREISAEAERLAAACQAGNVSPDELSGGTFTVRAIWAPSASSPSLRCSTLPRSPSSEWTPSCPARRRARAER